MNRYVAIGLVCALVATGAASQPAPSPDRSAAAPGPAREAPARRAGPRIRKRENFFGLPLLGLAFAGAGGAAAAAASGGGSPVSPS